MTSENLNNKIEASDEIKFYAETVSAVLPLSKEKFGFEKVRKIALDNRLNEKPEIHSTIIGYDQGKEILKKIENLTNEQKIEKLEKINNILLSTNFKVEPLEDYYLIEHDEDIDIEGKVVAEHRESIIQILKVVNGDVYDKLSDICGFVIEPTFPHVTLYTKSNIESRKLRGIGLYSKKDFENTVKTKLSL